MSWSCYFQLSLLLMAWKNQQKIAQATMCVMQMKLGSWLHLDPNLATALDCMANQLEQDIFLSVSISLTNEKKNLKERGMGGRK